MAETKIPALISMIKDVAFVDRLLHAKISDLNEYAYKRVDKRSNRTTISWRPYQQISKSALDSDLFLVVFSAVMAYLIAIPNAAIDWFNLAFLSLGGFLVTASSNTINQIIEKELDLE